MKANATPRHIAYTPNPAYTRLTICPLPRLPVAQRVVQGAGFVLTIRLDHVGVN